MFIPKSIVSIEVSSIDGSFVCWDPGEVSFSFWDVDVVYGPPFFCILADCYRLDLYGSSVTAS